MNGEAIFGTTPWLNYSEGPTKMTKSGYFMETEEVDYTAQDIRFTAKDDTLYATCLGWPDRPVKIVAGQGLCQGEIRSVTMLGSEKRLEWSLTPERLTIVPPREKPCEHAFVFKVERRHPFTS